MTGTINQFLGIYASNIFDPSIKIQFKFAYKQRADTTKMITISCNGVSKPYENFDYNDQALIHWIVFTAFHEYVNAPFVFIDLTDVNEYIITKIRPLLDTIAKRSQMFINVSHIYQTEFATFQIGVHKLVRMI